MFDNTSITPETLIVKCNIDTIPLKSKNTNIGALVNRLKVSDRITDISIAQLAGAACSGYSFTPAAMTATTESGFVSMSLFIVDIDNEADENLAAKKTLEANKGKPKEEHILITKDDLLPEERTPWTTVEDAMLILSLYGMPYSFIYYSFRHGEVEGKPKFRIVSVCNEVITDPAMAKRMNNAYISMFKQADTSTANLDRFYFGTDKGLASEITADTFPKEILLALASAQKEETAAPAPTKKATSDYRPSMPGDFDLNAACSAFDLLDYILSTAGGQSFKKGTDVCVKPCPICGHDTEGFIVSTSKNVFNCFSTKVGGNIITYLMHTKGFDKAKAADYFKYDILGRDREADKAHWLQTRYRSAQEDFATEGEVVEDNPYDREYIQPVYDKKTGELKGYKVLPNLLADRFRRSAKYMFVRDSAKQGVQRFFYSAKEGYYKLISDDEMRGYIKAMIPVDLQQIRDINECKELLYTDHKFYDMDDINANENLICFQNGTLELDTMTLRAHSPADRITIQVQCDYNPSAQPVNGSFDYFLDFLTGGDKPTQELLLQYMGAVISSVKGHRMKAALFMTGRKDAGKTLLKNLTARLIGARNCSSLDLDELEQKFGTSAIFNKRLAGSDDMSFMTIKELKSFKKATGGGLISGEFKGENRFDFVFNGLFWFCCNQLPMFGGDKSDAVFGRIMVVECKNVAAVLDKSLLDKMYAERDYIVSRAITALLTVIENGYNFSVPAKTLKLVEEYKKDVNSFLRFKDECTQARSNGKISDSCTKKRLYDVYVAWCVDNNRGYHDGAREVRKMLDEMGQGGIKKINGHEYYEAFTLTLEAKCTYSKAYGYDGTEPPER